MVHEPAGRADPAGEVRTFDGDERVEEAKRSPMGRRLGAFFKAPVWTVNDAGVSGSPARDAGGVDVISW